MTYELKAFWRVGGGGAIPEIKLAAECELPPASRAKSV